MRRFLLTLTVVTFAGWSQPAQPQAQPPIVVQFQPPPANPWTQLGNLAPGIIAALSALTVVWLTQRHQLRLEFHKAEIAAKYKSQDNRWEFRKDVYVNLLKTSHDILKTFHNLAHAAKLKSDPNEALRNLALKMVEDENPKLAASVKEFTTYATLAPLATADDVLPLLTAINKQVFLEVNFNSPDVASEIQSRMNPLFALLKQLQDAGRKDLWGTPEPEVKAEAVT